MATSTPTTHTTYTYPNASHDNMILNPTLDTENMEGTSTPIHDGQHMPLHIDITEIHTNTQL